MELPEGIIGGGIYKIECLTNGKVYIGQAETFAIRFRSHKNALKAGRHTNVNLQRSWNKYGEVSFVFSVIEQIHDIHTLDIREQHWIDAFIQIGRVFNTCKVAGCTRGLIMGKQARINRSLAGRTDKKSYVFISPSGERIKSDNLADFCRTHSLDYRSIQKMTKGRGSITFKGWTTENLSYIKKATHKLTEEQRQIVRQRGANGESMLTLAQEFGISRKSVWDLVNRRKRKR